MPDVQNKMKTAGRPVTSTAQGYEVVAPDSAVNVAGKRFYFIGAGGIGMSGLAQLMLKNGAIVSGSDQAPSPVTERLCQAGLDIKIGHKLENLDRQIDAVVISAAIRQDNPELQLARKRGYKIYKYAQMLGLLSSQYETIAVSGTHGKSTTACWLTYLLKQAGADPNFVIGAEITQLHSTSGVGDSKYFIAEACEYDRSFLNLSPKIACILNIEADHLDYYKDEDEIVEAFSQFARRVKQGGLLIANGTDSNLVKITGELPEHIDCQTFGLESSCNFYAQNIRIKDRLYTFDVYQNGSLLGAVRISLPGRHNILNALAVVAMACGAGLDGEEILQLLPKFTGIDRRLMLKGQIGKITVIDDYAHHPTEIKASLDALRKRYRPKRIWCVFQPHQHSRTRFLLDDLAQSFKLADVTIVPEIYFVRDSTAAKEEINSQILVERIRADGAEAIFIDDFEAICDYLKENVACGDLVVTMGAGNIWKVADEYIQWLRENS